MKEPTYLWLGGLAALYLLWLTLWIVLGDLSFGLDFYNWDQTAAALAAAFLAFFIAWKTGRPYKAFLIFQGLSLVMLSLSWVTYDPDRVHQAFHFTRHDLPDYSSISYAAFAFFGICAWGYLALEQWLCYPPTALTRTVFALLFAGLFLILANFYYPQYSPLLGEASGRLDAVVSGFEFLMLVLGLISILLRQSLALNMTLLATALLLASDLAYSENDVPYGIEAVWMFGQLLMLAAFIEFSAQQKQTDSAETPGKGRSGLSALLILLSLGGLLLAVAVGFLPIHPVWKSFYVVLFVVALVVIEVWLTDRFDDTVSYLKTHVQRLLQSRLAGEDWKSADNRIYATLQSTGLGEYLDFLNASALQLKRDVIFLGPERLFPATLTNAGESGTKSCFLVMPFSYAWSNEVHKILSGVCKVLSVQAVRGDDMFTPTDILVDIWKSLNTADFVIADITGRNPNVLYELGIAHTLAKPVLIISRNPVDIPIDLSTRRVILYGQNEENWREDLELKVNRAISEMIRAYGL
ncbi:MAG: hypothetical protein LUQ57_06310 [Methylococcaceae bacterium]|nr:hypothetical protein [Methylococcaceae bacterium]